jgi:hypothetical protein
MKVQIIDTVFNVQFIKNPVKVKYKKYKQDGSFKVKTGVRIDTYCKIRVGDLVISTGKSSCSPIDKYNHVKGKAMAMERALLSYNFSAADVAVGVPDYVMIPVREVRTEFWDEFAAEFGGGSNG